MNKKFTDLQDILVEKVVSIKIELLLRLQKLGHMFSTYSEVIEEILNHCDACDRFVEDRN